MEWPYEMRGKGLYLLAYVQPGADVLAGRSVYGTACFVEEGLRLRWAG